MRGLPLLLLAVVAAAGCSSMRAPPPEGLDPMDATPKTYDYDRSPFTTVGETILSVPETAVWWPYKIATSALRGAYDGAAGGIEKAPMPVIGVLLSPVTAGVGAVNGAFHGVAAGPLYVGSTGEFGRVIGQTFVEPIPLW